MSRPLIHSLLAVCLLASAAAHAGTVYVPAPGVSAVGAATYELQVSATNTVTQPREIKQLLLTTDTDGTQRPAQPSALQVLAGRTIVMKPAASFRGLLEISGPAEVRYSARLAGTGAGRLGVQIPVVTSENLAKGGKTVALQGLSSGGTRAAALNLVNLGQQAAQCTVSFTRTDGTSLGAPAGFALKPLSHVYLANVLGSQGEVVDVRAAVSCTRDFYAYALLSDSATGEVAVVAPAASGESILSAPGEAPGCPAGAQCFDVKGLVHEPTQGNPYKRVAFAPQPGTYTRVRLTMSVFHGGWNAANPKALHELFWLVKNRNFDMIGYATFRGPSTSTSLLRHGIGLTHPQKIKVVKPFVAKPGVTYRLEYTYDMAARTLELVTYEGDQVVNRLAGVPNVPSISFTDADRLIVDIGFDGSNPDEQPTLGWVYRDLHIEMN